VPLITSIEPQKKKVNRFNIYLDGVFGIGIDAEILLKNNLKVGQNLSEKQISELISKEELSKLTDKTLHFLSFRPRSERETFQYLSKKIAKSQNITFRQAQESHIVKSIVEKLKKYNYLDDSEFAKWWVHSRIRSNPKGTIVLKRELINRGITKEIIDLVLSKYQNQTAIAQKALQKKLKSWKNLSEQDFKKKVYSYLITRGFDFETIKEVFANFAKKR